MAETTAREAKLIQYLNEAFGKEKQLETALEAHIGMTSRASYRKRLQQHLQETKGHARQVQRRIKQLGGEADQAPVPVPGPSVVSDAAAKVTEVAQRGAALAQGSLQAVRGTGEQEKQLKNAKSEYTDEAEEIANYTAIETLAQTVGDRETAQLARGIRRQEQRMASFLERLIPTLTKEVAQAEIPAAERNGGRSRKRRTSARRTTARRTTARGASPRGTSRSRTTSRRTASSRTTRSTSRRPSGRSTARGSASSRSVGSRASGSSRGRSTRSTGRARSSGSSGRSSRAGGARSSRARAGSR
jgi:ferritin-like metal-binding protein YciE